MERIKFLVFIFIILFSFNGLAESQEAMRFDFFSNERFYETINDDNPGLVKNDDQDYKNVKKYFAYWCKNFSKNNQIISKYDKFFCSKSGDYGINSELIDFLNTKIFENFIRKIDFVSIKRNSKLISTIIPYSFSLSANPGYEIYDYISFYMDKNVKNTFKDLKIISSFSKCKRRSFYNNCYGKKKIGAVTYEGEWRNGCLNGNGKTKNGDSITFGSYSCGLLQGNGLQMFKNTVDNKTIKTIVIAPYNNGAISNGNFYRYDGNGDSNDTFRSAKVINGLIEGNSLYFSINENKTIRVFLQKFKKNKLSGLSSFKSYNFGNKKLERGIGSYFFGNQTGIYLMFDEDSYLISETLKGKFTGKAVQNKNNDFFKGEYFNGFKEGFGYQKLKSNSWSGNFSNDKRHGFGFFEDFENQSSSKGMFFIGKKNGWFLTCNSAGNISYNYFIDDKISSGEVVGAEDLRAITVTISKYKESISKVKRKLKELFYYTGTINELCDYEFRENIKEYMVDERFEDNKFILDAISSSEFQTILKKSIRRVK